MIKCGCVLLAGGKGTRMGCRNKAELMLDNSSFSERIASQMRETGFPCYLSSSAYQMQVPDGFIEIPDVVKAPDGAQIGPMGGIFSCLLRAESEGLDGLFFAPCDVPFYRNEIIFTLLDILEPGMKAVVFQTSDGRLQPLFGYYSVSCLPILEEEIRSGGYKMKTFLEKCGPLILSPAACGLTEEPFTNINTEREYRELQGEA